MGTHVAHGKLVLVPYSLITLPKYRQVQLGLKYLLHFLQLLLSSIDIGLVRHQNLTGIQVLEFKVNGTLQDISDLALSIRFRKDVLGVGVALPVMGQIPNRTLRWN